MSGEAYIRRRVGIDTFTDAVCGTSAEARCVVNAAAGGAMYTEKGGGAGPLLGGSTGCPTNGSCAQSVRRASDHVSNMY